MPYLEINLRLNLISELLIMLVLMMDMISVQTILNRDLLDLHDGHDFCLVEFESCRISEIILIILTKVISGSDNDEIP